MSEREIKRNGKGQIISFEIENVNVSTSTSSSYGKVYLSDTNSTETIKYLNDSYNNFVDIEFSEFVREDNVVLDNPNPIFEVVATNPFRDNPNLLASTDSGYPIWLDEGNS